MNRILTFVILSVCLLQSCLKQETVSYTDQLKKDEASLDALVPKIDSNAIKLPGGVWYSIDSRGKGLYPTLPDEITISYTLKSIEDDGLHTIGYSTSSTVLLSSTISGLQQGLIFFPANSSGKIYIPSGLAFGTSGHIKTATDTFNVNIGPNANLLYEIKLIDVKSAKFASDTTAIGNYLRSNSIDQVLRDSSGIRFTIDHIDTANHSNFFPLDSDSVLVSYTERIMTADTLITSVASAKVALADQWTCWRIMLPKYYKEGSTITMYSPSGYAYGSATTSATGATIPINSNMVYQVTLIKINPH